MHINITTGYLKLSDSIDFYIRKKNCKNQQILWRQLCMDTCDFIHWKKQTDNGNSFSYRYIDKLAFRAKEQSFNLYTSIDMTINKLEKQLKKNKKKFQKSAEKTI